MKLIQQKLFIAFSQFFSGIFPSLPHPQRPQKFRVPQFELQTAVGRFQVGLGRERPPVHFQVELPVPRFQLFVIFQIAVEKFIRPHMLRPRHDAQLVKPVHQLQHLLCDTASAVTIAKHGQCLAACLLVLIGIPVLLDLAGHIPRDEVGRRHAGIHLASIDPFPQEIVVREPVRVVPCGHLIGDKIIHA